MDISKENQGKIDQLSLIEENLRNFAIKKQGMQQEQLEINNAIEEIEKAEGNIYRIVGPVMVAADKISLKKELDSKKELIEIKLTSIEKQELRIKEKAQMIQKEVLEELEKNKNGK